MWLKTVWRQHQHFAFRRVKDLAKSEIQEITTSSQPSCQLFKSWGNSAWRLGCQSPAELSLVFRLALSFYTLRDLCPPCCHVSSIWKASAWYLVEAGNASKASFPALLPILCPELGESQKHFGGFLPKPCTCGKPRCFREYFSQLCCFARNLPCAVFMYSLKANGSNKSLLLASAISFLFLWIPC